MPSLRTAFWMCVFFYAAYAAFSLVVFIFGSAGLRLDKSLVFLVKQVAAWMVALYAARRTAGANWRACVPLHSVELRIVLPLALASVGSLFVLGEFASLIPMPESFREALAESDDNGVIAFLSAVVVAPLAEELFFRGWMLRGFLQHYSVRKSILLTATLFAVFHLNPWQAVVAFPLGIAAAWLVIRTGSLVPAIVSHGVVNGTGWVTVWVLGRLGYDREALFEMETPPLLLVAAATLMLAGGYLVYRTLARAGRATA